MSDDSRTPPNHVSTRNACKVCAPLGASLVFKGIAGAVPLLHGSQGCSTYIRRYLIGHFREPADIASSSFSEETTIFGGGENLRTAVRNIVRQYTPSVVAIATTCLAETIGEDVALHLHGFEPSEALPPMVHVSTPSYNGTHVDGFVAAVKALITRFAKNGTTDKRLVALFPCMLSCAELRHLRELCTDFGLKAVLVPDYSDTLDGGIWDDYHLLPPGGTTVDELTGIGSAAASIDFSGALFTHRSAGVVLEQQCGVIAHRMLPPIGIGLSDQFFDTLAEVSGCGVPEKHRAARQRLVDAYIDGHKIAAGKRAILFGDTDYVTALACFLYETGVTIAAIVTGDPEKTVRDAILGRLPEESDPLIVCDGDFEDISSILKDQPADILIGSSKGYAAARAAGIPLVRTGFPVQDRIGGQRLMHIGYEGTLRLYDAIINTFIEQMQSGSSVGYMTW